MVQRLVAALAVAAGLALPANALGAIEVNTTSDLAAPGCAGGPCSIRQALAAAAPGDTIHVPASATHYAITAGALPVTKDVTVAGDGPSGTILDAAGASGILSVTGAALTLRQATLTGGNAPTGAAIDDQGPGALTLDHVSVSGNVGGGPGTPGQGIVEVRGAGPNAVNVTASTLANNRIGAAGVASVGTLDLRGGGLTVHVDGTTFSHNQVGGAPSLVPIPGTGGGIFLGPTTAGASLAVSGSTFSDNVLGTDGASGPGFGAGGGIAVGSSFDNTTVTVTGSTFSHNVAGGPGGAGGGGAIQFQAIAAGATLTVDRSTFTRNLAGPAGGGIGGALYYFASGTGSTLSVTDSAFTDNAAGGGGATPPAGFGGGLYVQTAGANPTITVARDLIAGNQAGVGGMNTSQGGGIYLAPNTPLSGGLVNTTITGNESGGRGGGIFARNDYTTELTNVTLAGNTAATSGGNVMLTGGAHMTLVNTILTGGTAPTHPDCDGAVTSLGHNIEQGTDCGLTAAGDLNVDPLLGPLQANGGPTATRALLGGSPAIGAGLPSACPATDQRGVARAPTCDIGAYEAAPPAPPPPPGPGPGPAPPRPLACVSGQLVLTDVYPSGRKTQLLGVAPAGSAGQTVTLVSTWNRKTVATAKVAPDLSFSATAPLPPRKLRTSNRTRYTAKLAGKTTSALKFARRMYTTALSVSGRQVRFAGRAVPPLASPRAPVEIRASADCSTIAKGRVVARVKPSRKGTFTAKFTLPPTLTGQAIVFLRAGTRVRAKTHSRRSSPTFSLIRGVRVGS